MPSFAGQSAVVTGAARGIGRGIAELLASLGANVIAVDRDQRGLLELSELAGCTAVPGDLGGDQVEELAEEIWRRHGPIELLVNNVGVDRPRPFLEIDRQEFDATLATNLRGPWFFTKRLVEHLIEERRKGAVVFVSSLHDHIVSTHPHYSASKAAINMLVKELANELAPYGIRVNAVSPGTILTEGNPADDDSPIGSLVPLGRVGEPADVARITAVLLSEEWSGYVTGANVPVDGGLALHTWAARHGDRAREPTGVRRLLGGSGR